MGRNREVLATVWLVDMGCAGALGEPRRAVGPRAPAGLASFFRKNRQLSSNTARLYGTSHPTLRNMVVLQGERW